MKKIIPTMTVMELMDRMRSLGMRKSQQTVVDEIEQGIYPFAQAVRNGDSCKRAVTIYTKLFEQWVDERAVEVDNDAVEA